MRKLRETVVVGLPPLVPQDRWICKGGGHKTYYSPENLNSG